MAMDEELSAEEQRLLAADLRADIRFGHWMKVIIGLVLSAGAILLFQAVSWLKDGAWPSLTIRDFLFALGVAPGPVSWRGLQKMISGFLGCPLWVALLALAFLAVFWVTRRDSSEVPEALRAARMKQARNLRNRR